jgi:hypothetical protein
MKKTAIETGNEFVFSYPEVLRVREVGNQHKVASLVEALEELKNDFSVSITGR